MTKKIQALAISLLIILTGTSTVFAQNSVPPAGYEDEVRTTYTENPFPDTNITSLEGVAAAELYRRAVIGGFPDGEFKQDRPVNRAEAAKFLLLARGITIGNLKNNGKFRDVLEGEWYVRFIIEAANRNIINGHPDGTFRPADGVQRDQFMKMISRTFGIPEGASHSYTDVNSSAWSNSFISAAQQFQFFPKDTTPNTFEPGKEMTRGEVAIAIYQYLKNRNNPIPPQEDGTGEGDLEADRIVPSDWKTYTDVENGFSISYPPYFRFNSEIGLSKNTDLFVEVEEGDQLEYYFDNEKEMTITYDNFKADKYVFPEGYCDGPGCSYPFTAYVIHNRGKNIIIKLGGAPSTGITPGTSINDDHYLIMFRFKLHNPQTNNTTDTVPTTYCTAPAETPPIGGNARFPLSPKYEHMPHLGQLFTAYDCGTTRFNEVVNRILPLNDSFTEGSRIILDGPQDQSYILLLLQRLEYYKTSNNEWKLEAGTSVPLNDLMELRQYSDLIEYDDCVKCG